MPNDVAGSIRANSIDGIPYRVCASANLTEIFTKYENDMLATSGKGMRKMTKRIPGTESVELATNSLERQTLKVVAERVTLAKITIQNAAGDEAQAKCTIEVENNETEENKTTVKFLPEDDWTVSIA